MCGRFVLKATPEEIADYLDLIGLEDFPPRFQHRADAADPYHRRG